MFNIVKRQRWNHHIEQSQMFSLISIKHSVEVSNDQSKIISGVVGLFEDVSDAQVQHLHGFVGFFFDVQVVRLHFETGLFQHSWDVFDQVGVVLECRSSDHSHVPKCISNMRDQLSELIQIRDALLVGTQSLDGLREGLCSLIRIFVTALLLVLSEETLFLHQRVVDELIEQEFIEDVQLLDQELVESVDDGSHHTDSVSLDGVEHLVGADGFDLSSFLGRLHKDLSVDVVVILRDELAQLSQQLHNINTLLKLLGRKMRRHEVHLKLFFGKYTHMLVCLEVMRRQSRHLIEDTT